MRSPWTGAASYRGSALGPVFRLVSVPSRRLIGMAKSGVGEAVGARPGPGFKKAKKPDTHAGLVRQARKINRALAEVYPYAHPELDFENPFELLVATVLSAQTTDLRVNQTTPGLFAKYSTPEEMAAANPEELEVSEVTSRTGGVASAAVATTRASARHS